MVFLEDGDGGRTRVNGGDGERIYMGPSPLYSITLRKQQRVALGYPPFPYTSLSPQTEDPSTRTIVSTRPAPMSLVAAPTSATPASTHNAQYSLVAQNTLPWKTINSEDGKGGRDQNAGGGDNGRAAGGTGGGDCNGDENGGEDDDWDTWDGHKKKKEQTAQGEEGEHKRQEEATQRKKDIGLDPALVQDLFGIGKGSHVDFASSEALPLKEGRCLGAGVNGGVYETIVKGVAFAWKRRRCRKKASQQERKEIEILKRVTHHHIVQLVGTYTHGNFLGLLMWPVAVCDMATFFEDIEVYADAEHTGEPGDIEHRDRLKALGHLDDLARIETRGIYTYFGCLASAVAYLHKQRIRHKDLKPANVLLYRDSLRLTDFGTSTDSLYSHSASQIMVIKERRNTAPPRPRLMNPAVVLRTCSHWDASCLS